MKELNATYSKLKSIENEISQKDETSITSEKFARQLLCTISLVKYIIRKNDSIIYPQLTSISIEEQFKLIKGILDVAPIQYFTKMVPWVIFHLDFEEKVCCSYLVEFFFVLIYLV